VAAVALVQSAGWTLWYGDAEAHLAIARRVVDSRTPGWDQIGTVWLPLPHLLMLPLVGRDSLWLTGLAGAIPGGICFVLAGLFLFLAARRVFGSPWLAAAALGVFATNPNLLYLQAAPMTEPVMFAALMALLYCTVEFRESQSWRYVAGAGLASLAACMTRYEGWFLIPFVTVYFLLTAKRRFAAAILFGAIASAGPVYWLGHNWWYFGDALAFFNGPYSAKAIQGGKPYPGLHDWGVAWLYYRSTVGLVVGWGVCLAGVVGGIAAVWKRFWWPLLFLALPPAFYLWSMESSGGSPIFIPSLEPHGYYNTRYGLAALPLLALGAGALVLLASARWRVWCAAGVVLLCLTPWLLTPSPAAWICLEESRRNSEARRAWTFQTAEYLRERYRPGTGIFSALGDQAGAFREAGIPFREILQEGNGPAWMGAVARPDLFLHESWAVAIRGDAVSRTVSRLPRYRLEKTIEVPGAAPIDIYRLN
jgi:hypothetical protein